MKKIIGAGILTGTILFGFHCAPSAPAVDCSPTPSLNTALTDSTSTSVSHNFGLDCMSCHVAGGSAQVAWTVAGSLADAKDSTTIGAAGSTISNVGTNSLSLTVDACGNFYTTAAVTGLTSSSPSTASKSMGSGSWASSSLDGSCNRSGCHDNSSRSYVY